MGPQIRRAYDLADHFRARGKRVVLGGTWVTLTPEESLAPRRRRRRRRGRGRLAGGARRPRGGPHARASTAPTAGTTSATCPRSTTWTLPLLKADAFRSSWLYRMYFFWPVFFSRGCPHPCEYCAVQTYYQRSFRTRPVDEFIADIAAHDRRSARAASSSSTTTRSRTPRRRRSCFAPLIPLRVKWVSQATINVARDPELLDLVARSGARVLSIGFESLSEESLASVVEAVQPAEPLRGGHRQAARHAASR